MSVYGFAVSMQRAREDVRKYCIFDETLVCLRMALRNAAIIAQMARDFPENEKLYEMLTEIGNEVYKCDDRVLDALKKIREAKDVAKRKDDNQ